MVELVEEDVGVVTGGWLHVIAVWEWLQEVIAVWEWSQEGGMMTQST